MSLQLSLEPFSCKFPFPQLLLPKLMFANLSHLIACPTSLAETNLLDTWLSNLLLELKPFFYPDLAHWNLFESQSALSSFPLKLLLPSLFSYCLFQSSPAKSTSQALSNLHTFLWLLSLSQSWSLARKSKKLFELLRRWLFKAKCYVLAAARILQTMQAAPQLKIAPSFHVVFVFLLTTPCSFYSFSPQVRKIPHWIQRNLVG